MDFDRPITTKTSQATQALGEKLATYLKHQKGSRIVCLYGPLGAGKTMFSQGFAKALGLPSRLLSPTFIIVRRYTIDPKGTLFHIDLYRMETVQKCDTLGLQEIFQDPDAYILIEWAERLGSLLPKERIDVTFTYTGDDEREIIVQKITNDE